MEGWSDGAMERSRDGSWDGGMERVRDGNIVGWRDGGMEGWSDGAIEGWRHQGMERSRDGWMDMLDHGMGDGGMERESNACSEHSTIITLPFVGLERPRHSSEGGSCFIQQTVSTEGCYLYTKTG